MGTLPQSTDIQRILRSRGEPSCECQENKWEHSCPYLLLLPLPICFKSINFLIFVTTPHSLPPFSQEASATTPQEIPFASKLLSMALCLVLWTTTPVTGNGKWELQSDISRRHDDGGKLVYSYKPEFSSMLGGSFHSSVWR